MGKLESQNNFEGNTSSNILKKVDNSEIKKVQDDISSIGDIQNREKISNILDEVGIEEDQEKLINKILELKDNKNFDNILIKIERSFDKKDILEILEKEKVDDKKEKVIDKKEKIIDKKEKIIDKKEKVIDKKEKVIDKKEKVIDKKEKVMEINNNKEDIKGNLSNLKNSIDGLRDGHSIYGKTVKKLRELIRSGEYTNKDLKEILNELKNPKILESIAIDLKKEDPQKYEDFKSSLISIDSSFRGDFDKIDSQFGTADEKMKLGTDNLNGVDIGKDVLTKQTKDGFEIEVGDDGRSLSLQGSDYKFDSGLDNNKELKDIQEKNLELNAVISPINETLNSISSILQYIEDAILNKVDINVVKQAIKNQNLDYYNKLNIDSASSLVEIKQSLTGFYKKKEEEKDKYLKRAKEYVNKLIRFNTEKAKERDGNKKKTLKFLNSIGFDAIDQTASDAIFTERSGKAGGKSLGFNSPVDLANGDLGMSLDSNDSNSPEEKARFAEFVNILITGKKDRPINISSVQDGIENGVTFIDDEGKVILNDMIKGHIKGKLGSNHLSAIKNNIRKFESGRAKEN